eukprot:5238232-Alexandrium_andersonii.AAC.1
MLRVTPEDGRRAVVPTLAAPPATGPLVVRALGHAGAVKEAAGAMEAAKERGMRANTDVRVVSNRVEPGRGRGQAD